MVGSGMPAARREPLVARPLPLQAPTAFVRIRSQGKPACGEGRPGRIPLCKALASHRRR